MFFLQGRSRPKYKLALHTLLLEVIGPRVSNRGNNILRVYGEFYEHRSHYVLTFSFYASITFILQLILVLLVLATLHVIIASKLRV
jgi:hypothetical protein